MASVHFKHMMLATSVEPSKSFDPLSNSCTSTYQVLVFDGHCYDVTLTWVKCWTSHLLTVKVESPYDTNEYQCEISLQSYMFKSSKGNKKFRVGKREMSFFWDMRSAKYTAGSPQPFSSYYVALVSNNEIVLFLGDLKAKAVNDAQSLPSSNEAQLIHTTQNVCGKNEFTTKIKLAQEHDISIKSNLLDSTEPEMWISVDGAPIVQVTKLNWRFRGNTTVILKNMKLNILWDVHDWLFNGLGQGMFIFEPSSIAGHDDLVKEECQIGALKEKHQIQIAQDACFFLYAWKTD